MKLRNWLPTKYLTEDNPVIGLSFEVGFRRLLVMVGESIIFSMSNMIRTDVDSEVMLCTPAWMYRQQMSDAVLANKHQQMEGGFRRSGADTLEVRCAYTPANKSHFAPKGEALDYSEEALKKDVGLIQYTGKGAYEKLPETLRFGKVYGEVEHPRPYRAYDIYDQLLAERRAYKASRTGRELTPAHFDQLHRSINTPYLYPSVGTVGHVDHGRRYPPLYLTKAMYEKQMRDAGIEVDAMTEPSHTIRKLINNGRPGGPSGHSSLTAMCRNYKLTDLHGDRGVIPHVKVHPAVHECISMRDRTPAITSLTNHYIRDAVFRRIEAYLADKYYFTGQGMLPKGL